ncbi:AAA family ATPase [uncultured Chryseobacterium sp.]|uniref:AAA family ATPase n=1 Tax=uncultured Chryseobacterium sp. TaxID=259322 RepID=UPI0025E75E7D|nr:AAA family ATPase [uncultured Chryseobacterium sp.]
MFAYPEEYLIFKNIDSSLQDDEKKYYEEFKNIEKKLELGINTSINYNYALPYGFYIEFILYLKYYFEELVSSIVKTDLIDGNLSEIIDSFFATPKKFTKKKDLDRFKNIKKLYYLIIEKISYNYLNYTCARKDAIDIISLQEKISLSEQNENLISGARFFIPYPINILSSGEKSLINLFSNIYSNFSDSYQRYRDEKMDISNEFTNYNQKIQRIILFLDEADIGFHPQWKKKYIKIITDLFPKIFKEIESFRSIQIIFTTHDSLTLSDIPNGNIVYLKKDGDNNIKVLSEHEKPTKSFGANITDLLADSFFVKDGLMGDFAKEKIDEVIKYLNDSDSIITDNAKAKKIIDIIDEPILRYKLEDMYFEKFPQERDLEKEKDEILKRAQELGLNIQR